MYMFKTNFVNITYQTENSHTLNHIFYNVLFMTMIPMFPNNTDISAHIYIYIYIGRYHVVQSRYFAKHFDNVCH